METPNPGSDHVSTVVAGAELTAAMIGEKPGDRIGRYKLLQKVGEGGFGVVFMAEQEQPVRRTVALKVIKLGMDTREVIARFEAERQALALMDHPNIAKVLDAGATDAGRPYFVMELVRGSPITEYSDKHKLEPNQRIELLIQVCRAVQHAHQKGVIHRDMKPTNVLVTVADDRPIPKVIDFGIAKATQARLTDRTLFTGFRQLIGTPQYMSPEQADSDGVDVDTRTDVYSLGVLLYELLTGSTPADAQALRSAAYDEMRRMIREVDPPRPSSRISRLGVTLPAVAAARGTDPRRLGQLVRGELDWIVMRALEKDRSRRYETVAAFGDDLARHLRGDAVAAGPPGGLYHVRKYVRRHGTVIGASAVVIAVLLLGVAGTTIGFVRESRQRKIAQNHEKHAEQEQQRAEQRAAEARAVNDFLTRMIESADPAKTMGDQMTVLQAVTAAANELDRGGLSVQPAAEAAVRHAVGQTLTVLGRPDLAEPHLRRALDLRRSLAGRTDSADVAMSEADLGSDLVMQGRAPQADAILHHAVVTARATLPPVDLGLARCIATLATCVEQEDRQPEAEGLLRESLVIDRKLLPPGDPELASVLCMLGRCVKEERRLSDAEPLIREAIEIDRTALPAGHPAIARDLFELANVLQYQGKFADAEKLAREAVAIDRKALPADHPDLALGLNNLAGLVAMQNRQADAEPIFREALAIDRGAAPSWLCEIRTARVLVGLGRTLPALGGDAEAEKDFRLALAIYERDMGHSAVTTNTTAARLADLLEQTGRHDDAITVGKEYGLIEKATTAPQ